MRINKEHNERKTEILDSAERLFYSKGFNKCTVNDILDEIGIAKGTFYHYFASKEDVMDAIIQRYMDEVHENLAAAKGSESGSFEERLFGIFQAMGVQSQIGKVDLDQLHKVENTLLHQKILNRMISVMTPVLTEVIKDGVDAGVWRCSYPEQYMQIFLAAALTLTDEGIFQLDELSQPKLIEALITMLEKMLDATEGSLVSVYVSHMNQTQGENHELAYH
jgi:AcrR family transcriptional regulator